jgi:CheY-like chemotaxis protein
MGVNGVVLLVGEGAKNSPQLLQWLKDRGCRCQAANSCEDTCNLVSRTQFNLVLSDYQLPDGTAFPLFDRLVESRATLFFFAPVVRGSL